MSTALTLVFAHCSPLLSLSARLPGLMPVYLSVFPPDSSGPEQAGARAVQGGARGRAGLPVSQWELRLERTRRARASEWTSE